MDQTTAAVIALVSALTGLGSLFLSLYRAKHTVYKESVETQSLARKTDVEALSLALSSLREDYERLDGIVDEQQTTINGLDAEVRTWKRRFERVCAQAGLKPDAFITRPLGNREGQE